MSVPGITISGIAVACPLAFSAGVILPGLLFSG
jgi:hypothetical protein